ncbi:MAG: hypothetical protein HOE90_17970 [Bacteriovoracaceae bacterium]|jgi:hypothetical protein|nr:hypothetical protein [Bacteriovoracaceae bacterium]
MADLALTTDPSSTPGLEGLASVKCHLTNTQLGLDAKKLVIEFGINSALTVASFGVAGAVSATVGRGTIGALRTTVAAETVMLGAGVVIDGTFVKQTLDRCSSLESSLASGASTKETIAEIESCRSMASVEITMAVVGNIMGLGQVVKSLRKIPSARAATDVTQTGTAVGLAEMRSSTRGRYTAVDSWKSNEEWLANAKAIAPNASQEQMEAIARAHSHRPDIYPLNMNNPDHIRIAAEKYRMLRASGLTTQQARDLMDVGVAGAPVGGDGFNLVQWVKDRVSKPEQSQVRDPRIRIIGRRSPESSGIRIIGRSAQREVSHQGRLRAPQGSFFGLETSSIQRPIYGGKEVGKMRPGEFIGQSDGYTCSCRSRANGLLQLVTKNASDGVSPQVLSNLNEISDRGYRSATGGKLGTYLDEYKARTGLNDALAERGMKIKSTETVIMSKSGMDRQTTRAHKLSFVKSTFEEAEKAIKSGSGYAVLHMGNGIKIGGIQQHAISVLDVDLEKGFITVMDQLDQGRVVKYSLDEFVDAIDESRPGSEMHVITERVVDSRTNSNLSPDEIARRLE